MKLKLDHKSNIPLHRQAEDLLREIITKPEYANGKLLPKEVELSHNMNISRNTLRHAINKLVLEGLVVRRKGYGTIVAPRRVMSNARNWMSFSQEMASLGVPVRNFELHISHSFPDEEGAALFGVPNDSRLLCMERLRGSHQMPFVYFISWFGSQTGMTVSEDLSIPLYELLEKKYGILVKTSREKVSAEGASENIAEKLGIAPGDPILVRRRQVYDVDDRAVEYNIGYYRADSFTYAIEFTHE